MEGFVMSGSIAAAGLLLILYQFLPKFAKGLSLTIGYTVLTALIFMVIHFVEDIYSKKSGFYSPNFWPPAHYIKGPLMKDQGNNI